MASYTPQTSPPAGGLLGPQGETHLLSVPIHTVTVSFVSQ